MTPINPDDVKMSLKTQESGYIYREHDMRNCLTSEQFANYELLSVDDQFWISQLLIGGVAFDSACIQTNVGPGNSHYSKAAGVSETRLINLM